MNLMLAAAAVLAMATGVVHSVLGERLIFRRLHRGSLVPTVPAPPLQERHIRILWASWHLVSVLGWVMASILWRLAGDRDSALSVDGLLNVMAGGFFAGSLLVLVATRARHPGWIALGAIAVLVWLHSRGQASIAGPSLAS